MALSIILLTFPHSAPQRRPWTLLGLAGFPSLGYEPDTVAF
jgi:hypothetical protein